MATKNIKWSSATTLKNGLPTWDNDGAKLKSQMSRKLIIKYYENYKILIGDYVSRVICNFNE